MEENLKKAASFRKQSKHVSGPIGYAQPSAIGPSYPMFEMAWIFFNFFSYFFLIFFGGGKADTMKRLIN